MGLSCLQNGGTEAVIEHKAKRTIVPDNHDGYMGLVGCAPCMLGLRKQITSIGKYDCTVMVCGESGTGKELVARQIHLSGPRAAGPFVIADCTALPETLVASQLFGHVKGAFTDAKESTLGLVRAAHGGTLLIDEIGELQLHSQAKLLRCIQEHSVVPVGAVDPVHVDVRIIAATHRDLKDMVAQGQFREDLYYRLDVVRVEVPPLRDRSGDIALLAEHFLEQNAVLYGSRVKAFSEEALAAMERYAWLGNVRELRNAVERAVTLAEGDLLSLGDLPERMRRPGKPRPSNRLYAQGDIPPLHVVERRLIDQALRVTNGNLSQAAQLLEVERHRLSRMIQRHGLASLMKALRSTPPKTNLETHRPDSAGQASFGSDASGSSWAAAG